MRNIKVGRVCRSQRCRIGFISILIGSALLSGCGAGSPANPKVNAAPHLSAASPAISFGNVEKNASSKQTEVLTNTGTAAVSISTASVSSSGFSVSGLDLPMTLTAGGSVTFSVTFAPSSTGSSSGTLTVVSTAANSPLTITLSGDATAPGELVFSPATLGFGNVNVGGSDSQTASVEATGGSVTITSASLKNSEFAVTGISLPVTLAAGQKASFTVTFNPESSGTVSSALGFVSNAANSPTTQTLTGTGAAVEQHSVALDWNASAGPGVVGYNVYRAGASGGPYSKISSGAEITPGYTDDSVNAGQTYYYVTTAVNTNGAESAHSNEVQAVIPNP